MTTIEIPAGLVELKREFIRIDDELAALSRTMPSGAAILAGEVAEDPADREHWNALYARQGELAVQIRGHEAFKGLSQMQRYQLDTEASKQARAGA